VSASAASAALSALLAAAPPPATVDVRGTLWHAWSWPLSPNGGGAACSAAAPAGGGAAYSEFQTRLRYASHDRMGERALLEPALRLVHLLAPAAGASADARGPLQWPHMPARDLSAVCGDAAAMRCLRPEFLPPGGCAGGGDARAPPTEGPPWCTDWRSPVYIAELACGMTEVRFRGGDMAYGVHAESGAMLSHKRMLSDWGAPPGDPAPHAVRDYEALATPGYAEYPSTAGHFINELLPRLLHLDAHLPADVPLLWPPGAIPDGWAALLRGAGLLNAGRELLRDDGQHTMLRARRLYFYGSLEPLHAAPVVNWASQVLLAERLRAATAAAARPPAPAGARPSILLLGRERFATVDVRVRV
jgi:hypothetical protein